MAVDKQIFDLPIADVTFLQAQLTASNRMSTLIQVAGYDLDRTVDIDQLIALINGNQNIQVFDNQLNNPDDAIGKNGDFYKQTNGKRYEKINGHWEQINTPIDPMLPVALQPFNDLVTFTYNGSNSVQGVRFAPKQNGTGTYNGQPLIEPRDFYYIGTNIYLRKELFEIGRTYEINLHYYY